MKFCSECGAQIVGNGKFCINCGAPIITNGSTVLHTKSVTLLQPKLVSKTCTHRLEEVWKGKPKYAFASVGMIAAILGAFMLGPLFLSYLRGDPEYKMEKYMPGPGLMLFGLVVIVAFIILMRIVMSKTKDEYLRYAYYCQKEYLEVDENGIRGNNTSERVALCFEDIIRVEALPNDQFSNFIGIKMNILKITSRSGTSYSFYSFENSLELFNAIRQQITYSANNPARAVPAHNTVQPPSNNNQDSQIKQAESEQKDIQSNSDEKTNARKTAVAKPIAGGREKCSVCGFVQMAGRNICWECGSRFVR